MSAWYLLSVLIHDVQTGEVTRFVADQWLSVDRGTFEDDITIAASKETDELESGYLIKAGRARALSDDHVWWSIFTRPLRSRFSRYIILCTLYNTFYKISLYILLAVLSIPFIFQNN